MKNITKQPSALLRTFSSKLFISSPVAVAPWPPARSAFDRWLTSELEGLRLHPSLYATSSWLSKSLGTAISAQQTAVDSIRDTTGTSDTKMFGSYLDDTVDLLDACAAVRQRIEDIKAYTSAVSIALHWLDHDGAGSVHVHVHRNNSISCARAQLALGTCTDMEKRCAELDTCGSNLRKLGERLVSKQQQQQQQREPELGEILNGSRAIALLTIGMANIALSFRTRRGVPTVAQSPAKSGKSWGNVLSEMQKEAKEEFEKRRKDGVAVLEELKATVSNVRRLRSSLVVEGEGEGEGEEIKEVVRELRRSCGELGEGVQGLEQRVDGLYRGLIDVRMCLLGVISNA